MSWQTLRLAVERTDVAAAEALLTLAGADAISLLDAGSAPQLEPPPQKTPLWPEVRVEALFGAEVDVRGVARWLLAQIPGARIEARVLTDEEWQPALQERFTPQRIGSLVLAGAETPVSDAADMRVVRLNMGFAFGTGEHPTTRLCLEWLAAERPRSSAVLDYGCGSGVLALAALALGAGRAYAVDNDPQALVAARANAALNGVGERLWIGAPKELPARQFDLLLANILAGTLQSLEPSLAALTAPGGRIVLSGILEHQAAVVQQAYARHFERFATQTAAGWARIDARRSDRAG